MLVFKTTSTANQPAWGANSPYHILFTVLIISGPRAKSQPFPLPNGFCGGQSRKWVQGRKLVRRNIAGARQCTLYEVVTWACRCPNPGQGVHSTTHLFGATDQKCKSASTEGRSCSKEIEVAVDALCW